MAETVELSAHDYALARVATIKAQIAQLQGQLAEAENFARATEPAAQNGAQPNRAARRRKEK